MRAGLSTIQQTLTPEAASVLNQSIAEAGRRNHGQTTPLHVAATLLASSSGYLRQACIRSHPNSSHPLQCRALELCFSVALERLPSAQNISPGLEPPISNALMAALKRAQANQRRGCPEQQQQPLLAVKVELEQLIISILDDPSVSRVMREASFSSPAVKATIEQSINSANSSGIGGGNGLGFRPGTTAAQLVNRNLYLNPRLQTGGSEQSTLQRRGEVRRLIDIMLREKKRNPVLVGDSEPKVVLQELFQRIENREISEGLLRNVVVVFLEKEFGSDKSQIIGKLKGLGSLVDARISSTGGSGVILDLGDLKWLVEQPPGLGVSGSLTIQQQQIVSETGQAAVAEMGKMLATFRESGVQVWLTATATCETYLRCQVYHSSMENDWDLQAVPIAAAKGPIPGLFPRIGGNGVLGSSVESLKPLKGFPMIGTTLSSRRLSENKEPARGVNLCPTCTECYERELAKLVSEESEKSSSPNKSEMRSPLPQWMQIAKLQNGGVKVVDPPRSKDLELNLKRITEELQKKWTESCRQLHPRLHSSLESERPATANSMMSMYNSNLLKHQQFQPKLQQIRSPPTLQLSHTPVSKPSEPPAPLPESQIRTDLALGGPNVPDNSVENTHKERIKDFSGCIPSEWQPEKFSNHHSVKQATLLDADSFKSLFKGLTERVAWQTDAASAIATTIIQCRSGNPKRHGDVSKGDTWMLFLGPDKVGKRKMASALSELVCRPGPITISLTSGGHDDNESELRFRGKTVLDRIAEAVRRNPLSVVILNDIDQADMLVHGCIKRAIERGRLTDSHGREIGLGSVIFILTADWLPENVKPQLIPGGADEEKMAAMADLEWQLQLSIVSKMCKRRADWVSDCERFPKPRKESPGGVALSFDLNMAVETEEEVQEGSRNSSDLTVELEHEQKWTSSTMSLLPDLVDLVDDSIAFKPVDFGPLRSKVASTIVGKFAASVGEGRTIEVEQEAIDRIVGGVWFGRTQLEEWLDRVLVPSFQQLSSCSPADADNSLNVVRLSLLPDMPKKSCSRDWLPEKITVVAADRR